MGLAVAACQAAVAAETAKDAVRFSISID